MEDIVDKSKKYKIYLIILGVAAIISLVISYFMYLALIQQKEAIDETYEKIVNSGDETSKEVLDELNNGLAEEEKFTKEDAIELFETMKSGEVYNLIEQDKSAEIIGPFTMSCLSLFNGYMLIVILLSKIEHKYLKGLNKEELMKYMNQFYKEYLDLPLFSFHQFVGAKLTEEYFGIDNETVLDAIMFHCTGKDNMSSMAMIIYAADKTDPLRGYDSSKMIESMMNNYLVGFKYVLNENKLFLINKTHDLSSIENRLSKACFEYYLEKK